MSKFTEGQKVKVIKDTQEEEGSNWVGAIVLVQFAYSKSVTVTAIEGEKYPEDAQWFVDGDTAYFMEDELEAV